MSHTFKGTCSGNTQSSNGSHVAVLRGENGEEATIPSIDMLLVPGKVYTVSVDGEFAPKPKPVLVGKQGPYAVAERRAAGGLGASPTGKERRVASQPVKQAVLGSTAAAYSGPERRVKQFPAVAAERRHSVWHYGV